MRASLDRLRNACDDFDRLNVHHIERPAVRAEIEQFQRLIADSIVRICREVDQARQDQANEQPLERFRHDELQRKVLRHWSNNDHGNRQLSRRNGPAGDWQTIELICQNKPVFTSFHDAFSNYSISLPIAEQHRGKVIEQARFIAQLAVSTNGVPARLLNVGCGPSFDVRLATVDIPATHFPQVLLVDQDRTALDFSSRQLKAVAPTLEHQCLHQDAFKVMRQLANGESVAFDGILFGGLFDYLSDRQIQFMLRRAIKLLRPGGSVLFSQVSRDNPNRTFMDWFLDWRLIERQESELEQIVADAGVKGADVRMWREPTNLAILCRIDA